MELLEGYLSQKWGVENTLPSSHAYKTTQANTDANYSLANDLFNIDVNGTVRTAAQFDYETNASNYVIRVKVEDQFGQFIVKDLNLTLTDVFEDTDGDGFRDSLEASTGSNLNDPNSTPYNKASSPGTPSMAMPLICLVMETICRVVGTVLEKIGMA